MLDRQQRLVDLDELRNYVYQTLCDHHQLEPDVFPMTERILLRRGRACGVFFCIHGPGTAVFTAVWETDTSAILFYGPRGDRLGKTRLYSAPTLEAVGN